MIIKRQRKSEFVKLFDKTPPEVLCPHFYELILSNGCPFDCSYCYLKLTFRGKTIPTLFTNDWECVQKELDKIEKGVFSTGELADSLAVCPPLLPKALEYFENQNDKYLLLLTKSINIGLLEERKPSNQIIVSFSVNSEQAWRAYEKNTPSPLERIRAAKKLLQMGWRVRLRVDPIILECGIENYKPLCKSISELKPETVTIGTLRQYPGVFNFSKDAPRKGLMKSNDGRMRYSFEDRIKAYKYIESWLGFQPALCKETKMLWKTLGWKFHVCNCTV